MAITRAQQYKQMLQKGGRIGLRFGSGDTEKGMGPGRGPGGTIGGGVGPGMGGGDKGGSDFGQFQRRTRQNVASQGKGFLGKDQGMNIGPQSALARFGDVARGGLTLALSAINPAFGLLSRMGKNFKGSRTLEEFRDKMRGYGRTLPTVFKNRNLNQYIDDEEDTTSSTITTPVKTNDYLLDNALFADVSAKDINRLIGAFGKPKYNPNQDVKDIRQFEKDAGFLFNPTMTDQEIKDVLDGKITQPTGIYAAEGGMIGDQIRQAYGLGSIVKKATRAVKKVAKSPIGKAALAYTLTGGLGNLAQGQRFFTGFTSPTSFLGGAKNIFSGEGLRNILVGRPGFYENLANAPGKGVFTKATKGIFGAGGKLSALKTITAASLLPLLGIGTGDESEEEAQQILQTQGIDIDAIRKDPYAAMGPAYRFYAEGGDVEPVAKKTMPLLDMGGMEKDYRAEGGFVPIGRMEKADDVPARLSKNEFVFTADAVRNAGDGDVDKGAEVMYNMMKNLEAGGDVSEESQGLEGARKMFQTSKRLEEVL